MKVVARELSVGLLLGSALGMMGLIASFFIVPTGLAPTAFLIIPLTLLAVVICGTLIGSVLPITFESIGWDPAIMSTPLVAGIVDIIGIVIYVNLAIWMLG